ncbi:hypothetical protein [Sphingobacterium sp. LRF_L2]|uniref:hypothetical protein n=1 Tax=Sphingobacterium sp. LRF_L2 TaxID=3369421 RepID=UPI003F60F8E3
MLNNIKNLAICTILLLVISCKTEYTDLYNEIPGDTLFVSGNTGIVSFTVSEFDIDSPIEATIKGDSIVLLWSSYVSLPETINPTITVPDSASISPASGETVAFETGTKYTVTSAAGTSKDYFLKIDYRQTPPTTYTILTTANIVRGSLYNFTTTNVSRSLDNLLVDLNKTKVELISQTDNSEYICEVAGMRSNKLSFWVPNETPAGLYEVHITNGAYELINSNTTLKYWLNVREGTVAFATTLASSSSLGFPITTIKRGETFVISGTLLNTVTEGTIYYSASSSVQPPLEIVSATEDGHYLTVRIPEDTPLGQYNGIYLKTSAGTTSYSTNTSTPLVVTE